ncbi:TlyA family RNA methyltransferase [Labrys monachus]|uniref:23S rRNA (Cytidine1920-2'-O)/16S rRNA (Cytidine1409-2'-O)-methyltransferase n=1 Tax=Labrys monachus TaxID=217067 RepID=A0ABU0FAP4_9HYPH|nr:TlyA family RNA methyltransferase [Labrys monachus]MDQ0391689.1 23S rRNA (cytidine1920-2'-O)/16S rRNA (cytidine1409-2'-O)-methyltransferase [Labrys monachus]
MRKRADLLLVERGFFDSRARAQAAIQAGLVTADGRPVKKASEALEPDAVIEARPAHPFVSRGGVKLDHVLDHFGIAVEGRIALDVGASTGGFSDVLLRRGAAKVYAVDVGRDQLHASLRGEPRLVSLEGVDARRLDPALIPDAVDLVVADVSFISLALVLPPALALAGGGADLAVLIKPQFEAGRDRIGKGGIVRDEAVHAEVCTRIADLVTGLGWRVRGTVPSPIEGGDGNREFLLAAERVS